MKYETPPNNLPPYTLIMRKNTQVARAANPLTGAEKYIVVIVDKSFALNWRPFKPTTYAYLLLYGT